MMKMSNRKEELMNYINMLEGLSKSGFSCNKEITQALTELNCLMFNSEDRDRVFVLVLEKDEDGAKKSAEAFGKLLGKGYMRRDYAGNTRYTRGDTQIIEILNMKNVNRTTLRGQRPDILIDNSEDPIIKDLIQGKY